MKCFAGTLITLLPNQARIKLKLRIKILFHSYGRSVAPSPRRLPLSVFAPSPLRYLPNDSNVFFNPSSAETGIFFIPNAFLIF